MGLGIWLKKHLLTVLMLMGLTIGVGLLLYPSIANYWNSFHQTKAIISYNDVVSQMDTEDYEQILNDAKEYNRKLGEDAELSLEGLEDYKLVSHISMEGDDLKAGNSMAEPEKVTPVTHEIKDGTKIKGGSWNYLRFEK